MQLIWENILISAHTYEPRDDKANKMSVRPAKTQISPVWSESSLSAWSKLPIECTAKTLISLGAHAILLVLSQGGSYHCYVLHSFSIFVWLLFVAKPVWRLIKIWAAAWKKKTTNWHVRPVKTQISLLLCAEWVAKNPSFLLVDSEDTDQTGRIPGWTESSPGVHMPFCWFGHETAHMWTCWLLTDIWH